MLENIDLSKVLFLDIETVPMRANFDELDETFQTLWKHKSKGILKKYDEEISDEDAASVFDRAGIFAEFGKIICISVGYLARHRETGEWQLRLKSFADDNESKLLEDFSQLLGRHFTFICGHNIKEFDIPYICRRLLINQLPLPQLINVAGKKPWETKQLLDTLEFWKFGDNKAYTSLKLLAAVLGFPSPKDDIDGSEVAGVYWQQNDLPRIARYCEKDVAATVQLVLRLMRLPILEATQITSVA